MTQHARWSASGTIGSAGKDFGAHSAAPLDCAVSNTGNSFHRVCRLGLCSLLSLWEVGHIRVYAAHLRDIFTAGLDGALVPHLARRRHRSSESLWDAASVDRNRRNCIRGSAGIECPGARQDEQAVSANLHRRARRDWKQVHRCFGEALCERGRQAVNQGYSRSAARLGDAQGLGITSLGGWVI
jgi:hypothetical protein